MSLTLPAPSPESWDPEAPGVPVLEVAPRLRLPGPAGAPLDLDELACLARVAVPYPPPVGRKQIERALAASAPRPAFDPAEAALRAIEERIARLRAMVGEGG